jgi:hypothetical protein
VTLADDQRTELARAELKPALTTYEDDPYTWALEQAELLRSGRLHLVDAANLADEITALAHYLADKLSSDLSRVLQHLLKWDYQPHLRSRSSALSIREHRRRVARHLKKGPGLRSVLPDILVEAYDDGRDYALAEAEVGLSTIPELCPYTWDEIMNRPIEWAETP